MNPINYKDAGVDIEAGYALVKNISPLAKTTLIKGAMGGLGGFGGLFDLKAQGITDPILVSGADGVGTKLKVAIDTGIHETVGIDLVAMCANDILVQGAMPLFFMDYFATSDLNITTAQTVISGIAEGCKQAGAALLGGETAEMPDFYPEGHYDLAGFCVGAVERLSLLPKKDLLKKGDKIYALPSSGFHSNGYSLLRKLCQRESLNYTDICPWNKQITLGQGLLTPTVIYKNILENLLRNNQIKALSHITGGGITENLPRILPDDLAAHIDLSLWEVDECFRWAMNASQMTHTQMLNTFNCGIGMIFIPEEGIEDLPLGAFLIGEIIEKKQETISYTGTL